MHHGFNIAVTTDRVRHIAANALRKVGGGDTGFTSEKAEAFLTLHGEALEDRMNEVVRSFITDKLVGSPQGEQQ